MAWADAWTEIKHTIHWFQELYEVASVDGSSQNLVAIQDALESVTTEGGDFSDLILATMKRDRATLASIFTPANIRARLLPAWRNLGQLIAKPGTDLDRLNADVGEYMVTNNHSVVSRGIAHGTPSAAGGNTGDGLFLRCDTDADGFEIESVFMEAKTAKVDKDQGSVTRNQEEFFVEGVASNLDLLEVSGSGSRFRPVKAVDARRAASWVKNPSFDQNDATADDDSPTTITDWTVSSGVITDLTMRSASSLIFQTTQGVSTNWSVEFNGDVTLQQILRNKANPRFRSTVPYYCGCRIMRKNSCTGTMQLDFGANNTTVDVSGLSNDAWYHFFMPIGANSWYENFAEDNLDVKIGISSLATGQMILDHFIVYPLTFVDGTYYIALSGNTPWKFDDSFTWTDALDSTDSVIQYWLWRAGLVSLPHRKAATQVTAAGGRTLTFNDNGGSPDTITASSGSFVSDGYYAGMTLTVAGTSSNNGTYTLTVVAATTLTMATGSLAAEGPLSATATLNATASITDP